MQLFFLSNIDYNSQELIFDKTESQHLAKVLRKQTNDRIFVTNGQGVLLEGELTLVSEKKCMAKVIDQNYYEKKSPQITLAIAPTKSLDRIEWMLEKITELGFDELVPIVCDHSERKILKTDRLQKIALSALKQSNQFWLPEIHKLTSFKDFIQHAKGIKLIAHCEDNSKRNSLKNILLSNNHYTILIGPEGDFSPSEITLAKQYGFQSLSLGETRLRTETAGLVAVCGIRLKYQG